MNSVFHKQFIIIVGAPRSGTTWLSNIINQHPDVVGIGREMKLFSAYIKPLVDAWDNEKFRLESGQWKQGHPLIWSQQEFDDFITDFICKTYIKFLEIKPTATHILDKHPGYSISIDLIMKYLPNVKFIHVIRDGREVVPSMMSANKRIGFGYGKLNEAARHWRDSVVLCRGGASKYPDNFFQVRYNELKNEGESVISELFQFCNLKHDKDLIEQLIVENSYEKNAVSRPDPKFEELRRSGTSVWRHQFSTWDKYLVDLIMGDLLLELGFVENRDWWYDTPMEKLSILPQKIKHKFFL